MTDTPAPWDWKAAAADALEAQAAAIFRAQLELDTVEALLEHRGRAKLLVELRALAASLRSERADLLADARELHAAARRQLESLEERRGPKHGFPLALTAPATTRHPRGAP